MSPAAFTLKAQRLAREAVGKQFSVKVPPNSIKTGTIIKCEFAGLRGNAAAWRVVLQTPTGSFHNPVVVKSLPR